MDLLQLVHTPEQACEIVRLAYARQLDAPRMRRHPAPPDGG
jgi:hypothetical protein